MKKIYLALIALMLTQQANAQAASPFFGVCLTNSCDECLGNSLTASDPYGHTQTISNVPSRSEKCVTFRPAYYLYDITISTGSSEHRSVIYPNPLYPEASFAIDPNGSISGPFLN